MECNREEALRAKDIAEKKLLIKDFAGARKFALKAQQLYPGIENISRMICVCDVHCCAENKVHGNEMNWYGILQIEQTADDTLIKKQYRKFALLLHPDKNNFAGAEAAFKLIGEAQRVLLDKEKRRLHDIRRKTSYKPVSVHQQTSRNVSVKQYRGQNSFSNNHNPHVRASCSSQEHRQQTQPGVSNCGTFWTQCPFCSIRYKYFRDIMGRIISCRKCQRTFFAHDIHAPGSSATQTVFPQHNASASKVGSEVKNTKPTFDTEFQVGQKAEFNRPRMPGQSQKRSSKLDKGVPASNFRKANGQRGKMHVDSSESFESDSSVDLEESETADTVVGQQFDSNGDRQARRSNRNKRHISYNERASDDEEAVTLSKKTKVNATSPATQMKTDSSEVFGSVFGKEGAKGDCRVTDGGETVAGLAKKTSDADIGFDPNPESSPAPTFHEYPDPEFSDFDKTREECCFKVGQIWAAYDPADAMPRFYAMIKKIRSSGFKLTITWLEPDPDDEGGRGWVTLELPFACGKFNIGHSEDTEDRLMFSHVVPGCKSIGRAFTIYPRKGETWALFKNWDAMWALMPGIDSKRKYEYEFVEILSGYEETAGIQVAPLGKLKGFASLFYRKNVDVRQIPLEQVLRFSHMVPSYRMTGNERIDVPSGSFELDPASISMDLEEIDPPLLDKKICFNNISESTYHGIENGNKVEHKNNSNGVVTRAEFLVPDF